MTTYFSFVPWLSNPLWIIFFYSASTKCQPGNGTDFSALLAFKNELIDEQGALDSWRSNGTLINAHCTWTGISCGTCHPDRVVSINLESQGLSGSLSPYLGNLSFLRHINLQNNSFRGQIPHEFGRLRRLQYVEFSNNSFDGEIPRNLSQCQKLNYLNLIDNELTGAIPPEFSSLVKLHDLGLANNLLPGRLPSFIGNFTSLRQLSLSTCDLFGEIPASLGRLQNLRFLYLDVNNFNGTIPSAIFNISTMEAFFVDSNQLQGTIPSDIGFTFPNIRRIGLVDNNFTGVIPLSLTNASSLQYIGFTMNPLTGPMPRNIDRLLDLRFLIIAFTQVHDDIGILISSLTNCTKLTRIYVNSNFLTGSLPESIANLSTRLEVLSLELNQLHRTIPSGIGNLFGLRSLTLFLNMFSGTIPFAIGKLSNLQRLNLAANRFTNELPSSLGNMTLLTILFALRNNFTGSIPPSLGNYSNLLSLDLSRNNFNGSIPPGIMSLFSLSRYLDLSYNALMGSVPSEIGSLTSISTIDLSNNILSEPIPNTLSSSRSLVELYLGNNAFNGDIPQGLRALNGLGVVDLSRNNLSGPIPSFLTELRLVNLNLSFNGFQGPVPIGGVFANQSAISLEGNTELCGGISELNFPPCPSTNQMRNNSHTLLKVLIPTIVSGAILFAVVCSYILIRQRKKASKNLKDKEISLESQFQRLSYADLREATNGFSEANIIGSGRFGSIYKGTLSDGNTPVAVKVLNLQVRGAYKSFLSECNALRGARHRNLLKILSVAVSADFQGNDFLALVYQFKANGSLEQWLHQNEAQNEAQYLTFMQRLNITMDIAFGLKYLHDSTGSTIVHGDIKPSNILLDDDMTAHVGDFGLAKVISSISSEFESDASSSLAVKGTIGFVPPEYGMGVVVSTEGDAYSYGILLLELFTNLRPTMVDAFEEHGNFHNFVSEGLPEHAAEIIDPLILQTKDERNRISYVIMDFVVGILRIGVACSKELPQDRLSMESAVIELKQIRDACMAQGLC